MRIFTIKLNEKHRIIICVAAIMLHDRLFKIWTSGGGYVDSDESVDSRSIQFDFLNRFSFCIAHEIVSEGWGTV